MGFTHVEAFVVGIVLATLFYLVAQGMAWVESTEGMDQEDSQAFVELTNGRTLNEISELLQEGHKRIEEISLLRKRLEIEATSMRIAAEIERFSIRQLQFSQKEEESGVNAGYTN